ncbi:hypothetical protein CDV55_100717 [Aspergillus turcosus]|uniref:Uncharacterized protein n=1 Tax=Aspergillus turcosus TaxID=1245748 RepID=A0A229YFP9_9EURO|nr:hypothetical protein CDV55_100717 [Aspergillus turcosus]RLL97881.1 hypothetical protein CFD26_107200 [Aspergillus turcosus]
MLGIPLLELDPVALFNGGGPSHVDPRWAKLCRPVAYFPSWGVSSRRGPSGPMIGITGPTALTGPLSTVALIRPGPGPGARKKSLD